MVSTDMQVPTLPLYLGCPVWNCESWGGVVYPVDAPQRVRLNWYTRMFNTVECNSTFYAIPSNIQLDRWIQESAEGFRFSLKFPREISHDSRLKNCQSATTRFLEAAERLYAANRLGPSFLQLGPDFCPKQFGVLEAYLQQLPRHLNWGLELRHKNWFDSGPWEERINSLLESLGINKVIFDSRPLYQLPPEDESEEVSQSRKPKTPVRQTVTGRSPMLRLIGRNRVELTEKYCEQWSSIVATWIQRGLQPYVFTHTPNDQFAPAMARLFWSYLSRKLALPSNALPALAPPPKQLDLFGDL